MSSFNPNSFHNPIGAFGDTVKANQSNGEYITYDSLGNPIVNRAPIVYADGTPHAAYSLRAGTREGSQTGGAINDLLKKWHNGGNTTSQNTGWIRGRLKSLGYENVDGMNDDAVLGMWDNMSKSGLWNLDDVSHGNGGSTLKNKTKKMTGMS